MEEEDEEEEEGQRLFSVDLEPDDGLEKEEDRLNCDGGEGGGGVLVG